jgi:hypothetical protein
MREHTSSGPAGQDMNGPGTRESLNCRHRFAESRRVLFVGTDGARSCENCMRIEVLLHERWVALDDYLEARRSARERLGANS